jgi:cytoskeletal protein CcmA (bactofilin family)
MKTFDREDGFAMITAILVSLVVLSLSLVVFNLAIHNSNQSAFDRDRVQAIHAAEAGLDNYLSALVTNPTPPCNSSLDLGSTPVQHYDVSILLYSTWPPTGPGECPLLSGEPEGALVIAKGSALGGPAGANRSMETAVRLTPIFGGLNQAIFSDDELNLQNKLDINGNIGNDGDVYTNGNFSLRNNTVISGSVYAQGYAQINQGVVKKDVWANDYVDLKSISVLGNVTSSTSSISLQNSHVYGDAKAGTTITIGPSSQIDGAKTSNSPSGPPPEIPLPHVEYVESEWTKPENGGYIINNFSDCALAKTFISAGPVGNHVVRISPTCALSWGGSNLNLNGNMAIITDGSFTLSQQNNWNGIGDKHTLFIIRPWVDGLQCSPRPSPYDFSVSNNTSFNNLQVFIYSQCTIDFGNNNSGGFDGQIIGGQVNITNQMVVNFKPITVPGFNRIGYRSDVSYLREIPAN